MSSPEEMKKIASTLRKVAADMKILEEKKAQEKLEKCASIVVAKVGLNALNKKLTNGRR